MIGSESLLVRICCCFDVVKGKTTMESGGSSKSAEPFSTQSYLVQAGTAGDAASSSSTAAGGGGGVGGGEEVLSGALKALHARYGSRIRGNKRLRDGLPTALETQVDLLAQVVQMQALKIRKLESALARIETYLPEWGPLSDISVVKERLQFVAEDIDVLTDITEQDLKKRKPELQNLLMGPVIPGTGDLHATKKQTLYQAFMTSEMARIKTDMPEITQREAFRIAASNWAKHIDNPKNQKKNAAAAASGAGAPSNTAAAHSTSGAAPSTSAPASTRTASSSMADSVPEASPRRSASIAEHQPTSGTGSVSPNTSLTRPPVSQ